MKAKFSLWHRWSERDTYTGIGYPGIYVIAISKNSIAGAPFSMSESIVYVGMTNAVAGLKGRLKQFDNTIAQKHWQHGGADRCLYKHQNYEKLAPKLYVSMQHWPCNPSEMKPSDLRVMGKVAAAEYEFMATCIEELGDIPEFNRKKLSKKYSLTYGRS